MRTCVLILATLIGISMSGCVTKEAQLGVQHKWMLRGLGRDHWKEKLSGGGAAQVVFSAISLTDPTLRRQRADQHSWGRSCLEPLPATLNADQSLRSGEHGLQLGFPPKYAGQQSLEMARPVKPSKKKSSNLASPG